MKISCLPCSLFGAIQNGEMSVRQWAEEAARIGFDGFDISLLMLTGHTQTYIDKIRADLKAAGIPAVMATTYPDFTHPDARQRQRELDYLMRDIALCDQLGIQYLRVLAGQKHNGVELEEGIALASEYLHLVDSAAKKYGESNIVYFDTQEDAARGGYVPDHEFLYNRIEYEGAGGDN